MKAWWLALAFILQLAGVLIVIAGLSRGWREVRRDETLAGPVQRRLQVPINALVAVRDRIFRRQLRVKGARSSMTVGDITLGMRVVGGKTSNGPIDPDMDTIDAINILNDRINEVLSKVVAVDSRLDQENRELRSRVNGIDQDLSTAIRDQGERQRQRTVASLRVEIAGFALLTIGSVISGAVSLTTA